MQRIFILSLIIILAAWHDGASSIANAQQAAGSGNKPAWVPKCTKDKQGLHENCLLVRRIFLKNRAVRQKLLTIRIHRPKQADPFIRLQLPADSDLRSGVSLAVMKDKGNSSKLAYRFPLQSCKDTGCFANLELTDELLIALKTSPRILIGFANSEQKKIKASVSLVDFGEAYDALYEAPK